MDYSIFRDILNETLLGNERVKLFKRMSEKPERFVGLFRPSIPRQKLLQNIIQTREILFGDAMEKVLDKWIKNYGYLIQDNQITSELWCDLYFLSPDKNKAYLIEMKMRDDHDSTKRRGQWDNFERKVRILHKKHGSNLTAIFYFMDPAMRKNHNFYNNNILNLKSAISIDCLFLWYGSDLFDNITKAEDWEKLIEYLYRWKRGLPDTDVLNMESPEALRQLSVLSHDIWERIVAKKAFWDESFIRTLFPTGDGLRKIVSEMESYKPSFFISEFRQRIDDLYGKP